ncbi:MAG: sialidase family protein [Planctomycetota bacterium]|nr:sialidase family protein [Planctomycetota bacterium]MDA1212833.1 sialidase family protein [Planctomycetota bacterium]
MPFETLHEGWVTKAGPIDPRIAVGPRLVRLDDGTLLCSFMRQSALGVNDFQPHLSKSNDDGLTWQEPTAIWPHLAARWSMFVALSRDAAGNLYLFGTRTPIDQPGESFWSDASQGLKQNELIWATSSDAGKSWSEPHPFAMPIAGAAEAPGPICVTQSGRWLAVYSPYRTFDPAEHVETRHVIVMCSDDRGQNWQHAAMLTFTEENTGGAEAWVAQLDDGRLVGTGWHIDLAGHDEYPNAYAVSCDDGTTWSPTRSTGTMGQSTALCRATGSQIWFAYNQRKHGTPGVWLALAEPTEETFHIVGQAIGWQAPTTTRSGSSGDHAEWTDFSFGEPSLAVLADGTLFLVLWCIQPGGKGIRCVRLKVN